MSRKYKFGEIDSLYFVTYTVVGWIDVFTRNEYKNIVLDSLKFCHANKGLRVHAWCIMTNHVHLIMSTDATNRPDNILRDHKRHSSEKLHLAIERNNAESRKEWMMELLTRAGKDNSNNSDFQLWQKHNSPIEIYSEAVLYQKLDYIHNNPVRAGFVDDAIAWCYSSARDYAGLDGLLDCLELVDIGLRK